MEEKNKNMQNLIRKQPRTSGLVKEKHFTRQESSLYLYPPDKNVPAEKKRTNLIAFINVHSLHFIMLAHEMVKCN
jgi:hypothetical protein